MECPFDKSISYQPFMHKCADIHECTCTTSIKQDEDEWISQMLHQHGLTTHAHLIKQLLNEDHIYKTEKEYFYRQEPMVLFSEMSF